MAKVKLKVNHTYGPGGSNRVFLPPSIKNCTKWELELTDEQFNLVINAVYAYRTPDPEDQKLLGPIAEHLEKVYEES
jgi:hypothetical protein